MIAPEIVAKIFDAIDIVDVISRYVKLTRAGANYKGFSPFTKEKTPSFMVSPSKGIFKCFSSGIGGNAVKFLMEYKQIPYPEALRIIADIYHIEIKEKELSADELKNKNFKDSLITCNNFAAAYYSKRLYFDQSGASNCLDYLRSLGYGDETIKEFGLGYAPGGYKTFSGHALNGGYKKEYLVKSGLIIDKPNNFYDRFQERLIFPLVDLRGKIVGFSGRILESSEDVAKYINSPDSEIYHKGQLLYNLYKAKEHIIAQAKCYLVEGYTDVISMYQGGIKNVVATCGTALTKEQIQLIKRFTQNVTLIFDGDNAGLKATLKNIDMLLTEGVTVRVVELPNEHDPDSFIRNKGIDGFNDVILNKESDFLQFKVNVLSKYTVDPSKKAKVVHNILESISMINDDITRSIYIGECANLLSLDITVLNGEVNKIRGALDDDQTIVEVNEKQEADEKLIIKFYADKENQYKNKLFSFNIKDKDDGIRLLKRFVSQDNLVRAAFFNKSNSKDKNDKGVTSKLSREELLAINSNT